MQSLLLLILFLSAALIELCSAAADAVNTAQNTTTSNDVVNLDDRNYWLKRKREFYSRTKFSLTDDNLKLLGPKRIIFGSRDELIPSGHLPFWFDYELYKKVFNKTQQKTRPSADEENERHKVYINTCVRVLKKRALYRMLAGTVDSKIGPDADQVSLDLFFVLLAAACCC